MEKVKVNIQELKIVDIDGNPEKVDGFHKTIANLIYRFAKTVDLVEVARTINKGEPVEISKADAKEILGILDDPQLGVFAYVRAAIRDFFDQHDLL